MTRNDRSLNSIQDMAAKEENIAANTVQKMQQLKEMLAKMTQNDIAIAFSGGVDSSLLLKLACEQAKENGTQVHAILIHTSLHPQGDLAIARQVASETGALFHVLSVDELKEAGILDNPVDRCYLCKKYFFTRCRELADTLHITTILDGTNADDLKVYRPGIRALRELEICSPLAQCDVTKAEVREMAGELAVSVAQRPSAPCLATRFPYGTRLDRDAMHRVEAGEEFLKALGLRNVRIRVYDDLIRIETEPQSMPVLLADREQIIARMKALGFRYITLDLEGFRSGSMDLKLLETEAESR